jgi:formylglycine-generating enzyme required for sulfatase activity
MPPINASVGDTWKRPADGVTMVSVPESSFRMGSEQGELGESLVHEVSLDAFWIDLTEVSNAQYQQCVNDENCEPSIYVDDSIYNGDDYPVVGASWYHARDYCAWAGARLPTEAEWEYAARGSAENKHPWGDEAPNCGLAQFVECYESKTVPVGSFPDSASWVEALDMSGNVWEWVNDWYDDNYYANSPADNPPGPESGVAKVLRGGSWSYNGSALRGANRDDYYPDSRYDDFGFRCVVSPDE